MIRSDVVPETLDWGQLRWLSNPPTTGAAALTVIDVTLAPGKGHDFHKHPDQEEVLLIVAGSVEQWIERGEAHPRPRRFSAFVPAGVVHASFNAGRARPASPRSSAPASARSAMSRWKWATKRPGTRSAKRSTCPTTIPKLHNAMWPGIVGKGAPDSEPIIPLDTLLELTANAEADGQKFDGVDLFVVAPHFDIDSDLDAVKRMADHIAAYGLKVGSFVAPIWSGAGGGSAMGSAEERRQFLTQVRKASEIGRQMRELGIRPSGGIRIDSSTSVEAWDKDPKANSEAHRRDLPRGRRSSPPTTANSWSPRARSAGAACTPGARCATSSKRSAVPAWSASRPTWRTRCSTPSATTPRPTASCRRTSTGPTPRRSTPPTSRSPTRCAPGRSTSTSRQNDGTVFGSGDHEKTGRHCRVDDPNGRLDIVKHAGFWLRDDERRR